MCFYNVRLFVVVGGSLRRDGELVRSGTSDTNGSGGGRDSPERRGRAEEVFLRRVWERLETEGAGRAVGERDEAAKRRVGERQGKRTGGVRQDL